LETDDELMDHIYSGSRLCPGQWLRRFGYCFWGLILRLTRHFIRDLYYAPYDTSV